MEFSLSVNFLHSIDWFLGLMSSIINFYSKSTFPKYHLRVPLNLGIHWIIGNYLSLASRCLSSINHWHFDSFLAVLSTFKCNSSLLKFSSQIPIHTMISSLDPRFTMAPSYLMVNYDCSSEWHVKTECCMNSSQLLSWSQLYSTARLRMEFNQAISYPGGLSNCACSLKWLFAPVYPCQ